MLKARKTWKTYYWLQFLCKDTTDIVILNNDCNSNGALLKTFCMNNQLYIASTIWLSEWKQTYMAVIKKYTHIAVIKKWKLVSVLSQRNIWNIVKPDIDLDSDHCILMTSLYTPITHKAHRKLVSIGNNYKIQKPKDLSWIRCWKPFTKL